MARINFEREMTAEEAGLRFVLDSAYDDSDLKMDDERDSDMRSKWGRRDDVEELFFGD